MISVNESLQTFKEFIECFEERSFVFLKAYLDESIDIRGKATGKVVPSLCGYVSVSEDWEMFIPQWQSVLNRHHAKHFHFREFTTPGEFNKSSSTYYGWSAKKRSRFLFDMALEAGLSAAPVGAFTDLQDDERRGLNPYEEAIRTCFQNISDVANKLWPELGRVCIVCDRGASDDWAIPMKRVYNEFFDAPNSKIGTFAYGDDATATPLQAADMLTYTVRQNGERFYRDSKSQPLRLLDFLLHKNTPDSNTIRVTENDWRNLANDLMAVERKHSRERRDQSPFFVTSHLVNSYDFKQRKFVSKV